MSQHLLNEDRRLYRFNSHSLWPLEPFSALIISVSEECVCVGLYACGFVLVADI